MVEMRANLQPRISTAQTPCLARVRRRPASPTNSEAWPRPYPITTSPVPESGWITDESMTNHQ